MYLKRTHFAWSLCCLLGWAVPSQAQDIRFSGYGTVAAGTVIGNNDEPVLVDPITNAVYDDDIRFQPESLIALRAQTDINDRITATLQLTGRGGSSGDAAFEWAYLSYKWTPETQINAGRFRLPLFYYSDFIDTGYAYHWVRPPIDVYSIPSSILEGVNLLNTHYFNDIGITTQIWYGSEGQSGSSIDSESVKNQGINVVLEYEWFKVRALYNTLTLRLDVKPIFIEIPVPPGYTFVDPPPAEADFTFKSVAFMADYDSLIFRSEYTQLDYGGLEEEKDSAYASVGYMIGQFTPHVTYSYTEGLHEYETNTVGVRWDFMPAVALKLEYSNIHYETEGGLGVTGLIAPSEYRTEMVSAALDFVF